MIVLSACTAALAVWWLWPKVSSTRLTKLLLGTGAPSDASNPITRLLGKFRDGSAQVRARRDQTISAVCALAAELRAGNPPILAIGVAGGDPCIWPHAKAAAQAHTDISLALAADSRSNPQLRALTACWQVAAQSGSGLVVSIEKLAQSMREAQEVRIQLEAELAGPRATAWMLALLPLIGIGLGYLLGAQPLTWLFSHPIGWLTLIVGVTLTGLGVWWTTSIAARVEHML